MNDLIKQKDFDGSAVFYKTGRSNKPKLKIGQHHFLTHRGDGKIGSWRCTQHSRGCKARAFTFMVGLEVKYRFSCASHTHPNTTDKRKLHKKKCPSKRKK